MVNSQPFASFPIEQVSDNQLMTVEFHDQLQWNLDITNSTYRSPRYNEQFSLPQQ